MPTLCDRIPLLFLLGEQQEETSAYNRSTVASDHQSKLMLIIIARLHDHLLLFGLGEQRKETSAYHRSTV